MASLAFTSSFCGSNVHSLGAAPAARSCTTARPATVVCSAGNPWEKIGKALVATGAGWLIATSADAATIKLGSDSGELSFVPNSITVKSGEQITFSNNKGFPHNVVFDEENVPSGVDIGSISKEDLMNSPSDSFKITLTVPGKYKIYCEPHLGAGMSAIITVE